MFNILDFFDDVLKTLEANPYILWVVIICVVLLAVLVVLLIILNAKKHEVSQEDNDTKLIKQTLKEPEEEQEEVQTVAEHVKEEPVVQTVEEVKEETPQEEAPVVEDVASLEETPIEEKKPVRKRSKKVEEEPAVEETTIQEEVSEQEEVPVEEEKSAKKRSKKVEEEVVVKTRKPRTVNGKYEVYSDGTSYFYRLKASNGEVLIYSEAYATKDSVLLAIEAIKRNIEVGTIVVRKDKHDLYQFVLNAKNHRTLVMSANYPTEKGAISASESFKRFGLSSPIVEIEEVIESSKEEVILENIVDKKGGKLEIVASEEGYYYVLKASNGEILVQSSFYKSELSVQNALERFKDAVVNGKFFIEKDKKDNYQFKLYGSNGRLVCLGQIYGSKVLAVANVNSIASFIKLATLISEENNTNEA